MVKTVAEQCCWKAKVRSPALCYMSAGQGENVVFCGIHVLLQQNLTPGYSAFKHIAHHGNQGGEEIRGFTVQVQVLKGDTQQDLNQEKRQEHILNEKKNGIYN